jgi:hypothetical protein
MFELEDICEAQEMDQNKKKHRIQLVKYDEAKKAEMEHIKGIYDLFFVPLKLTLVWLENLSDP